MQRQNPGCCCSTGRIQHIWGLTPYSGCGAGSARERQVAGCPHQTIPVSVTSEQQQLNKTFWNALPTNVQQRQSQWQALSPRDLVRRSTRETCADAVCELGGFPRHLSIQNIFKGQADIKPLLLVTKSSAGWLRHKGSLLLPLGVHVCVCNFHLHNYLNSPSLASTLLRVLLIRRANSKTCLPAFGFCV